MEWMVMPIKRYADFQGRSRRMEYWMFVLGYAIFFVVVGGLAGLLGVMSGDGSSMGSGGYLFFGVLVLVGLALLVPSLAVQVRRFHDQDLSGWLILLGLIPYLGSLILFVFMVLPGKSGPNKYGPDPKDPYAADVNQIFN